jgi:hypothetical protein
VDADHRQRAILELRDETVANPVQILDQIPLGRAGAVEQRLVEVGQ